MDISKIDKNFAKQKLNIKESNIITLPDNRVTFTGGFYDLNYGFIKMPVDIANSINDNVAWGMRCGAGMKIMFSTNSHFLKLKANIFRKCKMVHMAVIGSSGFTLTEIVNQKEKYCANFYPDFSDKDYLEGEAKLQGEKERKYILYFPLYSGVESLTLEIEKGSIIKPYNYYKNVAPILYYGSSITQGGCASRDNNTYQSYVSEKLKVDYKIIAISGGAKAEPQMIDFLSNEDCSIFVCDYDYNAPDSNYLKETHLTLYKTFRSVEKNKNTPIIFMSKPDGFRDNKNYIRKQIILDTYNYALEHGDKNVYFIDGEKIYPKSICEHCSVDGTHPTDLGFYYMAKSVLKVIKENHLL